MAYVTLVTTDAYAVGAQVLAKSLRDSKTAFPIICLATPNLSATSLEALRLPQCFDEVRIVDQLDSLDKQRLALLGRPELGCTFTKIQIWKQVDLDKVVFIDADVLVLKNIDELFEREELSAVPDVGWPDCFNSGLFVCKPSEQTYLGLLQMANAIGSFDGGDQGLLNQYFSSWARGDSSRRLPFGYNLTFSASYSYLPAFKHFQDIIKTVHFIGSSKPWTFHRLSDGRVCPRGDWNGEHLEFVQKWWAVHDTLIKGASSWSLSSADKYVYQPNTHCMHKPQSPPASPSNAYSENVNFANYKISWSSDVEAHFEEQPSLSRITSPRRDDELSHKISYKNGWSPKSA